MREALLTTVAMQPNSPAAEDPLPSERFDMEVERITAFISCILPSETPRLESSSPRLPLTQQQPVLWLCCSLVFQYFIVPTLVEDFFLTVSP